MGLGIFGGYKIVNFKGASLSGTPVTITNIYYKAQSLIVKRFVATNFYIDNHLFGETDMAIHKDDSSNLICEVGAYVITITPQSAVTVEKTSGISSITVGEGLTPQGTITTTGSIALAQATSSTLGGFKAGNSTYIDTSTGRICASTLTDAQYQSAGVTAFVGKGTLETQLAKKVDKLGTTHSESIPDATYTIGLYGVNPNDEQKLFDATKNETANTIAVRDQNGNLSVATPTSDLHATTKAYVDNKAVPKATSTTIGGFKLGNAFSVWADGTMVADTYPIANYYNANAGLNVGKGTLENRLIGGYTLKMTVSTAASGKQTQVVYADGTISDIITTLDTEVTYYNAVAIKTNGSFTVTSGTYLYHAGASLVYVGSSCIPAAVLTSNLTVTVGT